jgi:hypothetical protein
VNEIFATNIRKDRLWFALCAAVVLLALFMLRLPALLPPRREASWVDALIIPAIIILVLAAPALLVLFPRAFLHRQQQLEIQDDGLTLSRGKKTKRYSWDDIKDVIVFEKDVGKETGTAIGGQIGGLPGGFIGGVLSYALGNLLGEQLSGKMDTRKTTTMTIQTSDGQKYKFDSRTSSWFHLLELLPETVSRVWSERYIRQLKNNEDVLVNDSTGVPTATLTGTKIANHQQAVPWEAVTDVIYESGQLAVRTSQPGLYSMRFNVDGGSVRGKALVVTIRAQAPVLQAELERKQKFADKPLWSPRAYGQPE